MNRSYRARATRAAPQCSAQPVTSARPSPPPRRARPPRAVPPPPWLAPAAPRCVSARTLRGQQRLLAAAHHHRGLPDCCERRGLSQRHGLFEFGALPRLVLLVAQACGAVALVLLEDAREVLVVALVEAASLADASPKPAPAAHLSGEQFKPAASSSPQLAPARPSGKQLAPAASRSGQQLAPAASSSAPADQQLVERFVQRLAQRLAQRLRVQLARTSRTALPFRYQKRDTELLARREPVAWLGRRAARAHLSYRRAARAPARAWASRWRGARC